MPLFFISSRGNPLDESRVSNLLAQMGRQMALDLKGTLKSSRLRKSIVSMQREQTQSSVTGTQLANQMGHSLTTAQKYYNIETEGKADARVALLIVQLTQGNSPPQVNMLVPETSDEEEEQSKQEAPHTITKKDQEQSEQDEEEEKEGGEEEEDGGDESDETPQSQRLMDELNLVQRNELLRLFSKNLKSDSMVMRYFIQVRMSKNKILKGVDTDVALDYLNSKKASDLSGVQKASLWVHSNFNEANSYASSSSGTSGRLFTGYQTLFRK